MFKRFFTDNLRNYIRIIAVFLIFTMLSLGVFFYYTDQAVERHVEKSMLDNASRQSYHANAVFSTQFRYLEGIAAYIGENEQLLKDENMALIKSLYAKSGLDRVALIQTDGSAFYDNGERAHVADRSYFQESMQGKRSLSDPVVSRLSADTRVVLSVPIYNGDTIVGVLGGSYRVNMLQNLLFEDIYEGAGYAMIMTDDGQHVICSGNRELCPMAEEDNFLEYIHRTSAAQPELADQIEQDFDEQTENVIQWELNGEPSYLSYSPIGYNEWMFCYVVTQKTAQESYQFISDYESVLIVALILMVIALLLVIFGMDNRRQKKLLYEAQIDALTGTFNKKSTEEQIRKWLAGREQKGHQVFLLLDVDKFKEINDHHGHMAGDETLREVGALLQGHFREGDIVGRVGGDEFVILMKNMTHIETVEKKAEALCEKFRNLELEGHAANVRVTCSIGIAYTAEHGITYSDLYLCADKALYRTKQQGRDGYTVYQE